MPIRTVCDIFYHSVDTYRKAEHLKYKREGAWRAIGSDELRTAVEELAEPMARQAPSRLYLRCSAFR